MSNDSSKFQQLIMQYFEKMCKEFQSVGPKTEEYMRITGSLEKIAPKIVDYIKDEAIEAQKIEIENRKLELESKKIELETKKLDMELENQEIERKKLKQENTKFWTTLVVLIAEFIAFIIFLLVGMDWEMANTMTSKIAPKVLQMLPQVIRRTASI